MRLLITGSAGHLGEGLMRVLSAEHDCVGIDRKESPFTTHVGSIANVSFVRRCMEGVDAVLHPATLHKPHVATHKRQDFVETNITGTLNLLEAAREVGVGAFVYTSTTSVFGHALTPAESQPAAWITEDVVPVPKNIYGITKAAAEDLCQLFWQKFELPTIVLRTSRFFPEADDSAAKRAAFDDQNLKVNELLHRRVDLADVVEAHRCALQKAPELGHRRFIVSATTPFEPSDAETLSRDAAAVVRVDYASAYESRGWRMAQSLDRVYDNRAAREALDWQPRFDFARAVAALDAGEPVWSPLALTVGAKGYHDATFDSGEDAAPFPVEPPDSAPPPNPST